MRFAARAFVAGIVLVSGRGVVAAETGSSWWPFGHKADAPVAQSAEVGQPVSPSATKTYPTTSVPTAPAPAADVGPIAHEVQMPANADTSTDSHWLANTPKKKTSWPKLEWPKSLSSSKPVPPKPVESNRWVEKAPVKPKTSVTQSVKKGASSVASGTKSAWNKTVDAVTPGSKTKKATTPEPGTRIAKRDASPSFWQKMMGAKEPEAPKTMPGFLAQKRLDP